MHDRSRLARLLARRVARERDRASIQWAVLSSTWLHALLVLSLLLAPRVLGGRDRRYFEMALVLPEVGPRAEVDLDRGEQGGELQEEPLARHEVERITPESREEVRFARTEEAGERPEEPVAISAHDQDTDKLVRAPVLSETPGLPTEPVLGPSERSGSPTTERRPGDKEAALGNSAEPGEDAVVRGAGSGTPSPAERPASGLGRPTAGDDADPGGSAGPLGARGHAASGSSSEEPRHPGEASPGGAVVSAVTAKPAPDAELPVAAQAPSWWQPVAMRVTPSARAQPPVLAAGDAGDTHTGVSPVRAAARAPVERAGSKTQTGGSEAATTEASLPEQAVAHGVRRRIAAPGTADPVEELRRDLGFGPLDRSKLAPRPAWAGEMYREGASASSPQVAIEAPVAWKTAVSTVGTPLGAYIQRVEELISARWNGSDLDAHSRAVGMQGDVTVRYQVSPDGRTNNVRIVRSSGNPTLDQMALAAIPDRMPRFPKGLEREPLQHEITLHYRNPLISP